MVFPNEAIILSNREARLICDLILEQYRSDSLISNTVFDSVVKVYLHDMGSRGVDVVKFITRKLPLELRDTFSKDYARSVSLYASYGTPRLLLSTSFVERTSQQFLSREKHLTGSVLETAVSTHMEFISSSYNHAKWEDSEYASPLSLIRSMIRNWVDRAGIANDKLSNLSRGNIINTLDRDAMDTNITNEVVEVESNTFDSDFNSQEVYASMMSCIEKGSGLAFRAPRSNAALRGLACSILNYFQIEPYQQHRQRMQDILSNFNSVNINVNIDPNTLKPHKYKEFGSMTDGHLAAIDPSYARSGVGNVSDLNGVYDRGIQLLRNIVSSINRNKKELELNSSKIMSPNFIARVYSDIIAGEFEALNGKSPADIIKIIESVLCANKLCSMLTARGTSILSFPVIELREGTWQRFRSFNDLLSYYRIHTNLRSAQYESCDSLIEYLGTFTSMPTMNFTHIIEQMNQKTKVSASSVLDDKFGDVRLDQRGRMQLVSTISPKMPKELKDFYSFLYNYIHLLVNETSLVRKLTQSTEIDSLRVHGAIEFMDCIFAPLLDEFSVWFSGGEISQESYHKLYLDSAYVDTFNGLKSSTIHRLEQLNARTGSDVIRSLCFEYTQLLSKTTIGEHHSFMAKFYNTCLSLFNGSGLLDLIGVSADYTGKDTHELCFSLYMNLYYLEFVQIQLDKLLNMICKSDVDSTNVDAVMGSIMSKDDVFEMSIKILNDNVLSTIGKQSINEMGMEVLISFAHWYEDKRGIRINILDSATCFTDAYRFDMCIDSIEYIRLIIKNISDFVERRYLSGVTKYIQGVESISKVDEMLPIINNEFNEEILRRMGNDFSNLSSSGEISDCITRLSGLSTVNGTVVIGDGSVYTHSMERQTVSVVYCIYGLKMIIEGGRRVIRDMVNEDYVRLFSWGRQD